MKISALKILEGEAAPWYYGFAYRLYSEAAIVCYPVPFNFIARALWHSWQFLRTSGVERKNIAYLAGYDEGFKEGERHGIYKEHKRLTDALNEGFKQLKEENEARRNQNTI